MHELLVLTVIGSFHGVIPDLSQHFHAVVEVDAGITASQAAIHHCTRCSRHGSSPRAHILGSLGW